MSDGHYTVSVIGSEPNYTTRIYFDLKNVKSPVEKPSKPQVTNPSKPNKSQVSKPSKPSTPQVTSPSKPTIPQVTNPITPKPTKPAQSTNTNSIKPKQPITDTNHSINHQAPFKPLLPITPTTKPQDKTDTNNSTNPNKKITQIGIVTNLTPNKTPAQTHSESMTKKSGATVTIKKEHPKRLIPQLGSTQDSIFTLLGATLVTIVGLIGFRKRF